ncbi:MAG: ketopantoate reductase [Brevibacterium sp.]|uniref:ketopantoate reductase family protein n=1 Tax=Brevibacterium sp. TaxID=1701 RepID=UPI002649344C|nr:2-dehydropantoate 2-reductase N-terminal domain-containing protein [Brevibacterium sp.]MDN5807571.1 ketopantoate reductase [Brevibacterium sp.]MDN5833963.1 ketopantoate reductase [Brevibacterium sp.]MDN6124590.1 ketopantoate reductase [Brevibacterium sp.]MDN6132887.1 ketopantoate reductase [Brevibacterium sp.]MDN6158108.1 ketopantoate reductase [Brevibacterium sp.]
MKILMFGRGVITTLYGWALEKAGNDVDFYVRPGRTADFGPSVDLDIRDGRASRKGKPVKGPWPVTLREDLEADHDYDLIIVSVNHDQLDTAVDFLSTRVGGATVLIFNNVWADPAAAVARLPRKQVVWGFPGGGGGYSDNTLHGGFVKSVFLGDVDGSSRTDRHRAVRELFTTAGFSISDVADFRSWLWFHVILDAGIMVGWLRMGSFDALVRSRRALQEVVRLVREMIPVLKAKGGTSRLGGAAATYIPSGLIGFAMHKLLTGDNLYTFIMDQAQATGHIDYEAKAIYPRDVLADARRLGVSVPRLEGNEPAFT